MESPSSVDLSDKNILGTLWAQLLLQFSIDCFETFQLFSAWNDDVHSVAMGEFPKSLTTN